MTGLSVQDHERLNTWLPEIAAAFRPDAPMKPQPDGSVRVGNKGSLLLGPGAGLWFDFEAGAGGCDALFLLRHLGAGDPLEWARAFLADHGGDGQLGDEPPDQAPGRLEASAAAASHFLAKAVPVGGTPAEEYLRGRGIEPPYPDNLKYTGEARLGEGALMAVVAGGPDVAAVQLTYVDADGRKSTVTPQRRLYRCLQDWSTAGGFFLMSASAPRRTVIAEGVEDALSLWKAEAGSTVIASLGVGHIGKWAVDTGADVVVFRDGDEPDGPAEQGLASGVDRLLLAGATVRVTATPKGEDANSLLQKHGPGRLLELVEGAEQTELSVEGWFEKCAAMDRVEYEQARKEIAKKLGVRVTVLDAEVSRRRPEVAEEAPLVAGIEDIEAWDEEVELASVLDEAVAALSPYLHMSAMDLDTIALWSAHAHCMDHMNVSPRLAFQSPAPGCGKTVAMEATALLVPRPLPAASITAAAVFRVIEAARPTLCLDEVDQLFRGENADLLAVLNSSHRKSSAFVLRVVDDGMGGFVPTQFSTWAAVMMAGIRALPATQQDRAIVIRLQRALPGEVRRHLRDGHCQRLADCGRKLARWAQDLSALPEVTLPPGLANRVGDNWGSLIAIAELAGSNWPQRVERAAMLAQAASGDDTSLLVRLLGDIKDVFGERERMSSADILGALLGLEEGPYQEANHGRPVTAHWLAQQLRGVIEGASGTVRIGTKTPKGYWRSQFEGAWNRYTVPGTGGVVSPGDPEIAATAATPPQPPEANGSGEVASQQVAPPHRNIDTHDPPVLRCGDADGDASSAKNPRETAPCGGVAAVAAPGGGLEESTSVPALTPSVIKDLMAVRKLSQRALAARAGVPQSSVRRLLSGKHTPHPETLAKIAAVLDAGDAPSSALEPGEAQVEERW